MKSTAVTKTVVGGKTELNLDQTIKGKILEYQFAKQKQNYAAETIRLNSTCLRMLIANGADLLDPESTKIALSRYKASPNRKRNVINAYSQFLKLNKLTWEKPRSTVTQKFPFIPTEQELDALISGGGRKMTAFLRVLKETAMRCGEAKKLQWTNIDFEKSLITLNDQEKGSLARMWRVTPTLMAMLNYLSRESTKVFGEGSIKSYKATYQRKRKRLAFRLQNPRLLRIGFHTFRHWKATELYHQTKDIRYVQKFLGHKSVKSTEVYINIEQSTFESASDGFTVKIAQTPEEIQQLLETGFEWVGQKDNLIFLRKRK